MLQNLGRMDSDEENTEKQYIKELWPDYHFSRRGDNPGNRSTNVQEAYEPAERRQTGVRERHSGVWNDDRSDHGGD